MLEPLEPRLLLDGQQIVFADPASLAAPPSAAVAVDVIYEASDGNDTLAGLGLRMHFDSDRLAFDMLTEVLPTFLGTQQLQDDVDDLDADPETDKLLLIFWLDTDTLFNPVEGDWPGAGTTPARLFTAGFTTAQTFDAATSVNFTASATAAGYTFSGSSATVSLAQPNLPPVVADSIDDVRVSEGAPPRLDHADLNAVFDDPDHDDPDLAFAVTAHAPEGIVSAQIDGGDRLDLSFLADRNGETDITVRATDPEGGFAETTFHVIVDPVNDAPTTTAPLNDVLVNLSPPDVHISLGAHFRDVDVATNDDVLTYTVRDPTNPALIAAVVNGSTLTLAFTPELAGVADLTIRATDLSGAFAEQSLAVRVNSPPFIATQLAGVIVSEDAALATNDLSDLFGDADIVPFGDRLTYAVTENTASTLVEASVAGELLTLAFSPDAHGMATVAVRASDLAGASVVQSFDIHVEPVNDAPRAALAIDDLVVDSKDPDVLVDLDGAFSDVDVLTNNDALTLDVSGNSDPDLVTTSLAGTTLTLAFSGDVGDGSVDITVRGTDLGMLSDEQTFTVTITSTNGAPAVVEPVDDLVVLEDAAPIPDLSDLRAVFDDPDHDDDALSFSIEGNSAPDLVAAVLDSDDTLDLGFFGNQNGEAEITVRATDALGAFADHTFSVTVLPDNDPPFLGPAIAPVTVPMGAPAAVRDLSDAFGDVDIATDDDELSLLVIGNTDPALITTSISGSTLTLSFNPGRSGGADLTVQATDQAGARVNQTFAVTVEPSGPADLVVTALTPPEVAVAPGGEVALTITVGNQGFVSTAGGYELSLGITNRIAPEVHAFFPGPNLTLLSGASTGRLPGSAAVDRALDLIRRDVDLVPGATDTFTFVVAIPALADLFGPFTFHGAVIGVAAEVDTANNTFATTGFADELVLIGPDRKSGRRLHHTPTGDPIKITLSKGAGRLVLKRYSGDTPDIRRIDLTASSEKTSLTIKNKAPASVGDLSGDRLKKLNGRRATLAGRVDLSAWLRSMKIGDIAADASVRTALPAPKGTKFKARRIGHDVVIDIAGTLKGFAAIEYVSGLLSADVLKKLKIRGNRKLGLPGNIGADVVLTGLGATRATLGKARIAGGLLGASWRIAGPGVGTLAVNGTVADSDLRIDGNVKSAKFGHMADSNLFAGVRESVVDIAEFSATDFDAASEIARLKVKGLFRNVSIAALRLGKITIGDVLVDNGGRDFGLVADSIGSFRRNGGDRLVLPLGGSGEMDRDGDFVFMLV